MIQKVDSLLEDIQKVKQIPIVHTLLEVVCRTTGLGFAAIARVTSDRWIACSVRDEIMFGLEEGGELKVETTICSEIRDNRKAVVIDDVFSDDAYRDHPTPKMYGFRSYISVPIFLKDGSFFGTLCAIDPEPVQLKNAQTLGLFMLFADLLSYHLHSVDVLQNSDRTIGQLSRRVAETMEENRQYHYVSSHNLSEPLRKLRLFSSLIADTAEKGDTEKTITLAAKISSFAEQFGTMMKDISQYSSLTDRGYFYEELNLNDIVAAVTVQLGDLMHEKQAVVDVIELTDISGIRFHLEHLFYRLIHNALKFSRKDVPVLIQISSHRMWGSELQEIFPADATAEYVEIIVDDNGRGIEVSELEQIFRIFSKITYEASPQGYGMGLAYCRKIARFHGGFITAKSTAGQGSTFTVFLPVKPAPAYNSRA
jgi:signal transduction histidine kinase